MVSRTLLWAVNANWNGDGWNVNANSVENPLGWFAGNQVLSRKSLRSKTPFYGVFVCFCQPPSIRPISSRRCDKAIYFLLSSMPISHMTWSRNFNRSSASEALSRYIRLFSFGLRLAIKRFWIVSVNKDSAFAPRPNFVNLSKWSQ